MSVATFDSASALAFTNLASLIFCGLILARLAGSAVFNLASVETAFGLTAAEPSSFGLVSVEAALTLG